MRIRATVAAVCGGALALSALAIPAAQASQPGGDRTWSGGYGVELPAAPDTKAPDAKSRMAANAVINEGDTKITKVVVNNGKPIVVGTKSKQKATIAITATDNSGIANAATVIWIGSSIDDEDTYGFNQNEDWATCKAANATTATCTLTVTVDPAWLLNSDAGNKWHVGAAVLANDGDFAQNDASAMVRMQRFSKLTVNASPEPVKKGATLTATGKLTRANWDTGTYKGYTVQPVKLQFRKKTSSTYTTVKTVKSSSTGALKTTTKASADGYWRYSFAGTSTTPAVTTAGDYVDVK